MEHGRTDPYLSGYLHGYQKGYLDGLAAAKSGAENAPDRTPWVTFPIESMEISARAKNCLHGAGCVCVADVLALKAQTIAVMRGLGTKTAREIAQWLLGQEILHTAWDLYL